MTWKNKFTAIQGRAQAAGAVPCKLTPTPGTRSPSGGYAQGQRHIPVLRVYRQSTS